MRVRGVGQTHAGPQQTEKNEDAYFVDDELGLYAVSDGVGGRAAGEHASSQAIRSLRRAVSGKAGVLKRQADAIELLREGFMKAGHDVYMLGKSDPAMRGLGCTLTAALVRDDFVAIGHVGDSRCYLCRDERVSQLTEDHTLDAELVRSGRRTPEEIAGQPHRRVLSRVLGIRDAVVPDVFSVDLHAGDALLLCTDGVSQAIAGDDWLAETIRGDALDATVEELMEQAGEKNPEANATAVLVSLGAEEAASHHRARFQSFTVLDGMAALRAVFLFEDLSMGLLSRLLSAAEERVYEPGEAIVSQGDSLAGLHVITRGTVRIERGGADLGVVGPGNHIAISSLMSPRTARATARAIDRASVLSLSRRGFWHVVRQRPWLGVNLLERLVTELSRSLDVSVTRRDDGDARTTPLLANEQL